MKLVEVRVRAQLVERERLAKPRADVVDRPPDGPALTVGLVELRLGRHDASRAHPTEASVLGSRFGNRRLASVARTQVASLALRTGHLDVARALLVDSVVGGDDSAISTQPVIFCLMASSELALARADARQAALALGAADGLRQRARLRAWPLVRRGEAELVARVTETLGAEDYQRAFADGSRLIRRQAVALVQDVAGAEDAAPAGSRRPRG